jgi:hypothetical protein
LSSILPKRVDGNPTIIRLYIYQKVKRLKEYFKFVVSIKDILGDERKVIISQENS